MKPLAQNTLIQNRYLVVHLIGKGGMGEVYLAVDQRLGSAVALKRTFFAGDEMLGNAFEREARTLARMRHPVLPKVSDHFGEGDEQYLVMEHISGDDLSKRLDAAGKPFPVSWVLFWADQLLDALSYLHTHEPPIIHRDIKPQNLKLTDENHVILLDFGLSKTSTGQTNISQSGSTGSVVGYTPHYAPMEQIRGIGTSPRSDLYSLSATLYQLMTNTIPVDALSRADAMLNEMPDPIKGPHEINPEVPVSVSDVILRGMEVSQEKRYANAREMQRVLRRAFNDIQQATTANTIAFTTDQAGITSDSLPAAEVLAGNSNSGSTDIDSKAEEHAIEPDPGIDLEATMAFTGDASLKQSEVRTEVIVGGNSVPPAPAATNDSLPPAETVQGFDSAAAADEFHGESKPFSSPPDTSSYTADATVPFIAVDSQAMSGTAEPSATMDFSSLRESGPTDYEQSQPFPETSDFKSADSEPAAAAAAAPYSSAASNVVTPAKKSSGKALVIVGVLAGLFLLGIAAAAGVWAFVNYGGTASPPPTPEPSPEETIISTPTPSPTLESISNTNVNSSSNVNSGSNSNGVQTVEPTPERTPEDDTPLGTRPTPKPLGTPRPTPAGPKPTPPPKKTPQPRPSVLQ